MKIPVPDVLAVASSDRLIEQSDGVILREVKVTHRLCRGSLVTGDDCIPIETDVVFLVSFFLAHRRLLISQISELASGGRFCEGGWKLNPAVKSTFGLRGRSLAGRLHCALPAHDRPTRAVGLWLHEIKHDGFRVIARRDGERVRLYSRPGNDLTNRFPLIVEAIARLPPCTLDGEAVACDDRGVPSFNLLLHRKRDGHVFLYAFDVIELRGKDLRREPLEQRKVDLRRLLADAGPGLVFNRWIDGGDFDGARCSNTPASYALRASCRSARIRAMSRDDCRTGSR
jgi:ATP dependent DNA ligase domain